MLTEIEALHMSTTTLTERLMTSYKQAFLYLIVLFVYQIIAAIVMIIGAVMGAGSLMSVMSGESSFGAGIAIGLLVMAFGFILFIVAAFAALIFAASRGGIIQNTVGFVEAYVITFKLILELTVVILLGIVLFILAGVIGGFIGGLLGFVGMILFLLFPFASMFYVINYLIERK